MLATRIRIGSEKFYPYKINQSCRFNDDDSPVLHFTPSSAVSDRTKFTLSMWFKKCNLGLTNPRLFSAYNNSINNISIYFDISDRMGIVNNLSGSTTTQKVTTRVFRDVGSWYHVCVIWDTADAIAENRCKIYINGIRETDFSTNNLPILNEVSNVGYNNYHIFGAYTVTPTYEYDGYEAECNLTNNVAAYTDFGKFKNGIWIPKRYTGSYGNNGFYLDFADSADLGNDVSGNNNDFTSSGLTSNDQVEDSPTNNYPTLNILHELSTATLSNGNLQCTGTENEYATIIIPSTGKWGWEITVGEDGSFGLEDIDLNEKVGADINGEIVEMLVDMGAGTLKKKVDGGTLETIEASLSTSSEWYPYFKAACSVDFGQLSYTPPTGYKALCSENLPTPSIKNSATGFDAITYEGNATVRDITNLSFQPDLVWIKNRDRADEHKMIDSVRGVTKELSSDSTNVESTDANGLTAFSSNGFSLGTGAAGYNDNAESFVAWCFRMGSKYGFDIQNYTGTGVAHAENHNLGGIPELMIVKNLGSAQHWIVYHHHALNKTDPETDHGVFNLTSTWLDDATHFNDTKPTTTQFTVGTSNHVNLNTYNHVAYLWRSIPQFSKVFSYKGNGNVDGPFVHCDFRPRYLLIKDADGAQSWILLDTTRNTYNVADNYLRTDTAGVEDTAGENEIDILSNGFKLRATDAPVNTNAHTYVGIAYAEQPEKWSVAR